VTRPRRIASYLAAAVALWLVAMLVTGAAIEARTRGRIASRVADSLGADAAIDRGNLALVRGWLDLEDLAVRRDEPIGHLAITVPHTHCELLPLGGALLDHHCRELDVHGARLEVSAAALFKLRRPRRPPVRADRVVIDDAHLEFSPSAFVPDLGRIAIDIAHAEAGETVFKTPLSWLFALRALHATLELPPGITLRLTYDRGELQVAGGLFGAPVSLPLTLPAAQPGDDARTEITRLVELGKDVAERVLARKAEDWLRSQISPP
jgi:hypothetical protein